MPMTIHLFGPLETECTKNKSYWDRLNSQDPDTLASSFGLFVDGGWQHFKNLVDLTGKDFKAHWVGDGDSLKNLQENSPRWQRVSKTTLPTDKDESDFKVALNWVSENLRDAEKIYAHGFLGGRLDHQLAILGEASSWLKESVCSKILMLDSQGRDHLTIFKGSHSTSHTGTFSVLSLEDTSISISGDAKYKGENIRLSKLNSLGLSNESSGLINFESDTPLILLKNFNSFLSKN